MEEKYTLELNGDEIVLVAQALSNLTEMAEMNHIVGRVSDKDYAAVTGLVLGITHKLYDAAGMDYEATLAEIEGRD